MAKDVPLLVLAATIIGYWSTVILLVLYKKVRHGQSAGVRPRQRFERRLWRAMLPMVSAWIALPVLAAVTEVSWLTLPKWAGSIEAIFGVRCVAAGLAVIAYLLSLYCWLLMGRSWSMAIVPRQTSALVTSGLYRWVRHPIYSLSVFLMVMTVVVVPTIPVAILAGLHLTVMSLKARNEERHLEEHFGDSYVQYCRRVGRFWPRWTSA